VQKFTLLVFPYFENDRIHSVTDPADGHILLWNIRPLVEPIWPEEHFLHLFEPEAAPWICSEALLFLGSKLNRI
jgi:hypothetical protein